MGLDHVRILVVCTANIARSPLCAVLLGQQADARLGSGHGVEIVSAGMYAETGRSAADGSQRIAQRWGLDLSAHCSQRITPALVDSSDLVLTMTADHRDRLVQLRPAALTRTFTVVEFARLIGTLQPRAWGDTPAEVVRHVVDAAHDARATTPAPSGSEDILDPYGGPESGYLAVAHRLVGLTDTIASRLFPAVVTHR